MKQAISIKNIRSGLAKKTGRAFLISTLILLSFTGNKLHSQTYMALTRCATAAVSGLDSLVRGLKDTSCAANAIQHRIILPYNCSMVGCDPTHTTPRILYVVKSNSPYIGMYWHVRGAATFWNLYGFCNVDTSTTLFPGGLNCSPNQVDYMFVKKIVNGVLVNETIPNITAIKNPRLMTPASPFWPLISSADLNNLFSPLGILVDVSTPTGTYTATLFENYSYGYLQWKYNRPCPTIQSLTNSNVALPGYGCQKFNFTATIAGYGVLCSNSGLTASWSFGDGYPVMTTCADSTGVSYAHQFGAAGSYTPVLTLNVPGTGNCTVTTSNLITVTCTPPPCGDCISSFAPVPGKKYLVSAWVKESSATQSKTSYTSSAVTILYPSISGSAGPFAPSGNIVDGWQRIEGVFTIPVTAADITVRLDCSTNNCYYDDVRVLPFDGSMKSYVYDPVNMRLVAELDEQNYATLYEYDEEGKLIRVKKETEKGKMTIRENRNNSKK